MTDNPTPAAGPICPSPLPEEERIQLGHGSGGRMSARLLRERFLPHLGNPILNGLGDAAVVEVDSSRLAISTDTFVVHPLEFPGGNIGTLAVNGTLNDLAMMGATPRYLTVGFVLEEGLEFAVLDRVLAEMARTGREAGVPVITGDTKVVERGKGDGIFINTTGVGELGPDFSPAANRARPGDAVLVSGSLGQHGMAVMSVREGMAFQAELKSDTANLHPLVEALRNTMGDAVHTLRDPTRGGMASALNEMAEAAGVGVLLDESALPISDPVRAACEMLGFDPLYVANEGLLVALVEEARAREALGALRAHPLGAQAARIGTVVEDHPGMVALRTGIGGTRVVDMLPGDQLPRIC